MKINWPIKKLGEVCVIQSGFGFPKIHQGRSDELFPFLKVSDMNLSGNEVHIFSWNNSVSAEDLKKYGFKTAPTGTIIFPKVGGAISTNKKRILSRDSVYDNNVMGLIPAKEILSEYLYHWFLGFNLSNWAFGSTLPAINQSRVAKTEIPLPPLSEQKKIVAKLEKLLSKIKEAKRLRVEAQEDASQLLPAELHKIFEEGKKKGWKEKSFDDESILKMASGGTPSRSNTSFYKGSILWLKSGELQDNTNIKDSEEKISEEAIKKSSAKVFSQGTVLFAMYGATAGKIGILGVDASTNQAVAGMMPVASRLSNKFLYYFLLKKREEIISQAWGGAQPNLSQTIIKRFSILLPPLTEQKKIVERLDILSGKIRQLQDYQKATQLDFVALEQSILAKAFSNSNL